MEWALIILVQALPLTMSALTGNKLAKDYEDFVKHFPDDEELRATKFEHVSNCFRDQSSVNTLLGLPSCREYEILFSFRVYEVLEPHVRYRYLDAIETC